MMGEVAIARSVLACLACFLVSACSCVNQNTAEPTNEVDRHRLDVLLADPVFDARQLTYTTPLNQTSPPPSGECRTPQFCVGHGEVGDREDLPVTRWTRGQAIATLHPPVEEVVNRQGLPVTTLWPDSPSPKGSAFHEIMRSLLGDLRRAGWSPQYVECSREDFAIHAYRRYDTFSGHLEVTGPHQDKNADPGDVIILGFVPNHQDAPFLLPDPPPPVLDEGSTCLDQPYSVKETSTGIESKVESVY